MTKKKLQKIYEVIANKTLSFGCKLLRHSHDGFSKEYYILGPGSHSKRRISSQPFGSMDLEFDENMISKSSGDWYEVVGHSVMIGDVLDFVSKNHLQYSDTISDIVTGDRKFHLGLTDVGIYRSMLLDYWREKRKPIDSQSEECIDCVLSLIDTVE